MRVLLLLSLLLTLLPPPSSAAHGGAHPPAFEYLKLPLLHNNHPFPPNPSHSLAADSRRLRHLHNSLHRRRNKSAKLPVTSGSAFGTGQYFVSLSLGTPPQPFLLVADTGSDLLWVSCSACRDCSHRRPESALFARRSTTFSPYHCYDSECDFVPPPKDIACNNTRLHSTCRYEYSYSDGSLSSGFFGRETATFNTSSGKAVKFKKLAFGCGFNTSGPSLTGPSFTGARGVMGLGLGPISFPTQLSRRFGNKFSYCLMDYTLSPTPTSYLLIGGGVAAPHGGRRSSDVKMSYTPLMNNSMSPTFYYIGIESVYVDGTKLPISPSVWAIDEFGNGGTVLDSGTTLTYLAKPAYDRVLREFKRRVELPKPDEPNPTFDFCINVSSVANPSLPKLSFKLSGGSMLSLPSQNYFIDTAEDIKCLALKPVLQPSGFSLVGNLMQQGFTFEFDKDRGRLGFTRQGCAAA